MYDCQICPKMLFSFEKFSIPEKINPSEAIVKISLTTICGSDVHTWLGHRPFPTPAILGHEIVGKIVKLGNRNGDNAPTAIIELIHSDIDAKGKDSGPIIQKKINEEDQEN